jgi:hypothetical protein
VALQLFGFHGHPSDFAVTKIDVPLDQCAFLLDFSRPLKRHRQLFGRTIWFGVTVGLLVPVVHHAEQSGGFVISVNRGAPYFIDLPKLWKKHYRSKRILISPPVGGLEIIANFATHFPEDCS